jgi:hypothetical protein
MGGRVSGVCNLTPRDFTIREIRQFSAACLHLDRNVLQRGAVEIQAGRLMMVGAAQILKLAERLLLKLLDLHKSILALICFFSMTRRVP